MLNSWLFVRWGKSGIFDDDMFGRALGQPENSFQVTEGRFGGISSIYDPEDRRFDSRLATQHNPFGYISATSNYQVLRCAVSCMFFFLIKNRNIVFLSAGSWTNTGSVLICCKLRDSPAARLHTCVDPLKVYDL